MCWGEGWGGGVKCDRSVLHQGSCGGIVVSSIMKLFTIDSAQKTEVFNKDRTQNWASKLAFCIWVKIHILKEILRLQQR